MLGRWAKRPSLNEIGLGCGVVKAQRISPLGQSIVKQYEPYLDPIRKKPVRLLELGIEKGRSLRMWQEYFSNATVVGVDAHPKTAGRAKGFLHVQGFQEDPEVLKRALELLGGSATVIVDDCSHRTTPTWLSLTYLWEHLEPGGLYFIEDLNFSWSAKWKESEDDRGIAGVLYDCMKDVHSATQLFPGLEAIEIRWRLAALRKTHGHPIPSRAEVRPDATIRQTVDGIRSPVKTP